MKKTKLFIKKPVALVTGAASQLGSAISRKLAAEGFAVALHYGQSETKTLQLRNQLKKKGGEVLLAQADLSDPGQSSGLIQKVAGQWGRLDLIVNNASLFQSTDLNENSWENWHQVFNVNTFTPVGLILAARPWLEKGKGSVVNITDIYGEFPVLKEHAAYSASKAGLIFLTKYLALALGEKIRVNAVSPGVITFPGHYSDQHRKRLVEKSALRRQGKPEEIAEAVWFLVSNQFVTGQILRVDGGRFTS